MASRRPVRRQQRFELADDGFARLGLRDQLDLVAMLVALEEPIARGAEPLPHGL